MLWGEGGSLETRMRVIDKEIGIERESNGGGWRGW